jgi:hypothetical protein
MAKKVVKKAAAAKRPAGAKKVVKSAKAGKNSSPKPKKKVAAKNVPAKKAAPEKKPEKKKAPKRPRAPKEVRLKAFWGVFNQSLRRVAIYEFNERKQADKKAAELTKSGKSPHFVQPVKEQIVEG